MLLFAGFFASSDAVHISEIVASVKVCSYNINDPRFSYLFIFNSLYDIFLQNTFIILCVLGL